MLIACNFFNNFKLEEGFNFPINVQKEFLMTRKDMLKEKSIKLKPKILEYLKTHKDVTITELMRNLEANFFEIKFVVEELKKEGKIRANE